MADGISFNMLTGPFKAAISQREARMPGAAQAGLRVAAQATVKAARAKAPVLTGTDTPKFRKSGKNKTTDFSRPVPGLLKASIASAKKPTVIGPGIYSVKVGPRGQRVHLYAGKEEARAAYMEAGYSASKAALPGAAQAAFDKVWKE